MAEPRYVIDIEMWSGGDIVYMRVSYSDGTEKTVEAPISIPTYAPAL